MPLEIIFIDDHSSDGSSVILNKARNALPNISIIENSGKQGKKTALAAGLQTAQGDWIIQTDADCALPEKWIEIISAFIDKHPEKVLVSAPVVYNTGRSVFFWFFELDFLSLVFTGAGYTGINRPVFCNGANMAYRRDAAVKLPDPFFASTPSGDDVFLMQQLAEKQRNGIAFLKSRDAIVKTSPPVSPKQFLSQRARWGSKAKYYRSGIAKFLALSVFSTNLVLLLLWALAAFGVTLWIYALIFTIIKFITDAFIMIPSLKFFERNKLLPLIIPASVMYPFYNVIAAFASLFMKTEWKK